MKDKYIEEKLAEFDEIYNNDGENIVRDLVLKQFLKETIKQTRLDTIKEIEGVVGDKWENMTYEESMQNDSKRLVAGQADGYNAKRQEIIEALNKLKE